MSNCLTIEMLKEMIKSNRFHFTHQQIGPQLLASLQREEKLRDAIKIIQCVATISTNRSALADIMVIADTCEEALKWCEYPAESEK